MTHPDRIHVCFPILYYPPYFGGHGIQIQRSLPYLKERGIDLTIVAQRLPDHLQETDPRVIRLLSQPSEPLARLRRVVQLRRFFRQNHRSFDLVHTELTGWELMLNLPYLRSLGLPIVYEMILDNDPSSLGSTRGGGLRVRLMRDMDAWIGISRTFLPKVTAAGIPADRFHLIYVGVETERYVPRSDEDRRVLRRRLGIPDAARVVLSAGSIMRRKGMDRMVEAWAATEPRAGRDLLILAGPDKVEDGLHPREVEFASQIRKRTEERDLAGTVHMTGRVENLEEYMAASDLFVFLSRMEGLGLVTLEAMSSGLPAIVSPMDGIGAEVVEEGETGHVVADPDDRAAVGSLIRALLDDPSVRARMGAAGRKRAQERFSMEARASGLEKLYRELLAERRRR